MMFELWRRDDYGNRFPGGCYPELSAAEVFNPRYPLLTELAALLEKTISFHDEELQQRLLLSRRSPRRRGTPL